MTEAERRARGAFVRAFGGEPALVVRAPGRVNLIGEHTDYNDGFVLPCTIDRATYVAARATDTGEARVVAADYGEEVDRFAIGPGISHRTDSGWPNYVRGVVAILAETHTLRGGVDLAIAGDVPQGAGLSSSASLEVAIAKVFALLQPLELGAPALATVAQRAENAFVGMACGIMDQMISAAGQDGHALRIDCRSLDTRAVPMPPDLAVMIFHSRVERGLVDSKYNERRRQCEEAARVCEVAALRDLSLPSLLAAEPRLDPMVFRRARHIVTENARTLEAAEALAAGDLARLGRLMAASHASMRDDFAITVPAVDDLAAIAGSAIGEQGGARMTGGGFGGCVVALAPVARVDAVCAAVDAGYRAPNGERAQAFVCRPTQGASAV